MEPPNQWPLPQKKPTEASAARKGARRDSAGQKTMSGLQVLVEYLYSATPSNCGETHPTLEHRAARRQGARGQGNDLGYGKSIEGRSSLSITKGEWKWAIRSQVPAFMVHNRKGEGCRSQTTWRWVFLKQKGLRYSRASLATGQETSNYAGLTLTVP